MGAIRDIIERGAAEYGISLPELVGAAFETYYSRLESRGRDINLTAVTGEQDVARLHFLDSIALLKACDFTGESAARGGSGPRVIDVGSGAGFPGLPMKLAEPSIDLTLLDATGKRVAFLEELCGVLGVGAACIHARAEELSREPDMREQFDVAVSRAVARLNVLCELILPFVMVGGLFLAMKGVDSAQETAEAENAVKALGARLEGNFDYTIPGTDVTHRVVTIRKISATPETYPRRFARIEKSPL